MADLYTVKSVRESVRVTPQGKTERVLRIDAESKSGISFSVEVAESGVAEAQVKKALDERAKYLENIRGM